MMKFLKKIKALFTKSDVEKTSLQKTARISIIFACIALVGVIVYFAVIAPLMNKEEYVPELFDGEVYQYSSIYILPVYERSQIASVEIKNSMDHYTLKSAKDETGAITFKIEGSEHIVVSEESLSMLLADVRVLLTNSPAGQDRVTTTATQEDLVHYGLDDASNPAYFEVTLVDGGSYRIYIGKPLVTTTGYYVRMEGRTNKVIDENGNETEYDIVYALQSSLGDTVLQPSTYVVSTELTPYIGNDIFGATDFTLVKWKENEREVFVKIGMVADQNIAASAQTYEMIVPSAYTVHEDIYSKNVLMNLAQVKAYEIVAYGDRIHEKEVYEAFGLDLDEARLDSFTDNNHVFLTFNCSDPEEKDYAEKATILYFSEMKTDINGTKFYYVYSPVYEIVGKVSADTYAFVDWSRDGFLNANMYYEYFTSTEVIDIYCERENLDLCFLISGKERSRHIDVMTSGGKEIVYKTVNGEKVPLVYDAQYIASGSGTYVGEFENFKSLYYVLITRKFALYAEIDESTTVDMENVAARISITSSPKDHPISYYKYDSNGNRITSLLRDEGGNILCSKVTVPSEIEGGAPIVYERAYYDIKAKRFFLKTEDPHDGNMKPNDYSDKGDGTVKVDLYLKETAVGEYVEKTYVYEFHDMYDTYINANGEEVTQLNSTYMYIVPTVIERTYSLTSNGEKELLSETKTISEEGVYIRIATINKFFSDTNKFMRGEQIDHMGAN